MMLVFYIILAIIILVLTLIFITYFSKIEIDVKNLYMNSMDKKQNNNKLVIYILLKIGKYSWLKFKIKKEKITKIYDKIKKIEDKNIQIKKKVEKIFKGTAKTIIKDKKFSEIFHYAKIDIQELQAELLVGTENPIITSYTVAFIAIIISNILPHIIKELPEKINYKVQPIYQNRNIYILKLNGKFSIKIKNIIHIVLVLIRLAKLNNKSNTYKEETKKENMSVVKSTY